MKFILLPALFAGVLSCLTCASAHSQARAIIHLPPPPVGLLAPRLVLPGTTLLDSSVVFTPATYDALRRDYAWQTEALALKQRRLDAAATIDTSTTQLLLQSQRATNVARAAAADCATRAEAWQRKYLAARERERPFVLLDKRVYLGGGIGLGLGAAGVAWLWSRFH